MNKLINCRYEYSKPSINRLIWMNMLRPIKTGNKVAN